MFYIWLGSHKTPICRGNSLRCKRRLTSQFIQNISGQTIFDASAIHFNIYLTKQEPQALRNQRYIIHIRLYTIHNFYASSFTVLCLYYFNYEPHTQHKFDVKNMIPFPIGIKQQRRSNNSRSVKEANLLDIINALTVLDKANKMPTIVIDYMSLSLIPRSHPEELSDISLCDRLNKLENRIAKMMETLDSNIAQNMDLKQKMEKSKKLSTYSAVAQHPDPTFITSKASTVATHMMTSGRNITSSVPTSASVANFHSAVRSPKQSCAESPNVCDATNTLPKCKQSSLFDNIVGDTKKHDTESDFQVPKYIQKHERRQDQRKRGIISGTASNNHQIKGAPEPDRHLFIYKVDPQTSDDALRSYISECSISIRSLQCASNPASKYKSYKRTVPLSDFKKLFSSTLWPEGIRVRKFVTPSRTRDDNKD